MQLLSSIPSGYYAVFAAAVLYFICAKRFKFLGKFLLRAVTGLCAIYFANILISRFTDLYVGVNLLSALVIGILGMPGFVLLYAAELIL
ncbi:MAG: pro-sigmaK processing inhibitor BofA family protein [Clostridiales bacterium]|jgi:inhibitor of the pro-sigma K processing machinery|nr:pro-sigmaK processing inhibitor BofA family protein [Clostridiales bacterium]